MSRLVVEAKDAARRQQDEIAEFAARRLTSLPPEQCPVDFTASLIRLFQSDSCGKCTPCRTGLGAALTILDALLRGGAEAKDLDTLAVTARTMCNWIDCGQRFAGCTRGVCRGFRLPY